MPTKKFLVTKFYTDVTDCSDAIIDLQKAFIRVCAGEGQRVEFEVITEDEATTNATAERLLRLVRSEFKANDEQGKADDEMPVIRIENNGKILSFDVGKEGDDAQGQKDEQQ